MKLAILIVGEYRTFPNCVKSMTFLDQPNIDKDIYFSTWNKTNTIDPKLPGVFHPINVFNTPIYRDVSLDEIQEVIGIPVTQISLHPYEISPFPPMVDGWLLGFDLIRKSPVYYSHVLVIRPDLFFNNSQFLVNEFNNYIHSFGFFREISEEENELLTDTTMFSTYENMEKILSYRLKEYMKNLWIPGTTNPSTEWHNLWYNYIVRENNLSLTTLPMTGSNVINRFSTNGSNDYHRIWEKYWIQT
jgi:hypothetical protein